MLQPEHDEEATQADGQRRSLCFAEVGCDVPESLGNVPFRSFEAQQFWDLTHDNGDREPKDEALQHRF